MIEVAGRLADHLDNCTAWGGKCLNGCGTRDRLVAEYREARSDSRAATTALGGAR
jgi:hypothetical protein